MAPLPKQGHVQVDEALATLARSIGIDVEQPDISRDGDGAAASPAHAYG